MLDREAFQIAEGFFHPAAHQQGDRFQFRLAFLARQNEGGVIVAGVERGGGRAVPIQRRLQRRPRQFLVYRKDAAGRAQNDLGKPSTCSAM